MFYRNSVRKTHGIWGIRLQKCCDLEKRVRGPSRSLEMSSCDRAHMTSYKHSITSNHRPISHCFRDRERFPSKIANTICDCGKERESVEHFLWRCSKYQSARNTMFDTINDIRISSKNRSRFDSVRITKMLMGGLVFASEASEKKIFRPLLGGRKKLKVDCLVVTNSTNCFMLFIVKCDKIISAASYPYRIHPVFITYFLVNETQTF